MDGNIIYKTIDLFGNEQIQFIEKKKKSNKTLEGVFCDVTLS